jgi:hypothetical protein
MRLAAITQAAAAVALLALGAIALHELRYLAAFGGSPGADLRAGHDYMEILIPLLVVLAVAALAVSVVVPAVLRLAPSLGREDCVTERAAGYAAALLAVHLAQELAEAALSDGHPVSVAGILGAGGWAVIPLAMALGAVAALARGWLHQAERRLAVALARVALPRAPQRIGAPPPRPPQRPLSSLGLRFGIARRPPPLVQRA